MRLPIGGVLHDAAALWRAERDIVTRIAGVFFVLPILALTMLATGLVVGTQANPEQVREAVTGFYAANLVWLMLITLVLDFGGVAMIRLFVPRGTTVRELLATSAVRLLPYVLLGFANGALINLGFWLFVVPGVYIFGRSWMMGAAYAAEPERGLFAAVERGFRMSANNGWRIAVLGTGTMLIAAAAAMVLLMVTQMLTVLTGGSQLAQAVFLVPVAVAAAAGYVAFTLVRIAIYRRLAGSSSGT